MSKKDLDAGGFIKELVCEIVYMEDDKPFINFWSEGSLYTDDPDVSVSFSKSFEREDYYAFFSFTPESGVMVRDELLKIIKAVDKYTEALNKHHSDFKKKMPTKLL
jgi:hypothetical protein